MTGGPNLGGKSHDGISAVTWQREDSSLWSSGTVKENSGILLFRTFAAMPCVLSDFMVGQIRSSPGIWGPHL